MNIGYARVSTLDQNLDLQMQALKKGRLQEDFPRKGLRRQPGAARVSADARSAPPRRYGDRVETRPSSALDP